MTNTILYKVEFILFTDVNGTRGESLFEYKYVHKYNYLERAIESHENFLVWCGLRFRLNYKFAPIVQGKYHLKYFLL